MHVIAFDYTKILTVSVTQGQTHPSAQLQDAHSPLELTKSLRKIYVDDFPQMAPSSQGVPSKFDELQRDKHHTIHWNQPPSASSSIPPMLLHPIFGKFINDCKNYEPTAADNRLVWMLSAAMSHFFDDEDAQASMFWEILQDSGMEAYATVIDGTKFKTDRDIHLQGFRHAIIEVKNEIGSKGAKPHAQAISYYICSTMSSVTKWPGFTFPCILILLFGKLLIFRH